MAISCIRSNGNCFGLANWALSFSLPQSTALAPGNLAGKTRMTKDKLFGGCFWQVRVSLFADMKTGDNSKHSVYFWGIPREIFSVEGEFNGE